DSLRFRYEDSMMAITFAQMGFGSVVTESSATADTDGYVGTLGGLPYHIHPTATPAAYEALEAAIAASEVTVIAFTPPVITLAEAQVLQQADIASAYESAISSPVSFKTSAGLTSQFDADADSQMVLMQAAQGYTLAGSVPAGFYWVAADDTQVPFTLADLSGLYQAMLAQGWSAFQKKQALKAQISAATSVQAVQAVVWA
ncbi:MAG: DUF4376 domain-containing protein, partial [Paraburkholderia fungorum]|nr:DUF4376 domain-containing protein [Paraburkholderia fungorum]